MAGYILRLKRHVVDGSAAPEFQPVGAEALDICAGFWHSDSVAFVISRSEVQDHNVFVLTAAAGPRINIYGLLRVVCLYPLEALPVPVVAVQSLFLKIEVVQGLYILKVLAVGFVLLGKEPFKAFVLPPLYELSELLSHEVELCSGVGHLIKSKDP